MPELPEVETVARGMARVLEGRTIAHVVVNRPDLRRPIPTDLAKRLTGATVTSVSRRAKYALIHTDRADVVILHLGMSGRVRLDPDAPEKHDHVVIKTNDGNALVFNDPRRFGSIDITPEAKLDVHPLLAHVGPEPLGNAFHAGVLAKAFKGKKAPLKAALLDQTVVAGLGNIYVCEALFQAGLSPLRLAGSVKPVKLEALTLAIRAVLIRAIAVGGSTLRDYVQVDGELGYFQHEWSVYGREGEPCRTCTAPVLRTVQSGRSSFYCKKCQK